MEERVAYFRAFIQRVQLLEMQGMLSYGEVLRCEDFLSDSSVAFAKVCSSPLHEGLIRG